MAKSRSFIIREQMFSVDRGALVDQVDLVHHALKNLPHLAKRVEIVGDIDSNKLTAGAASANMPSRGGNDLVIGGLGEDKIYGGDGADRLYGGANDDAVRGDEGNDIIYGGPGHDWLHGDAGDDILYSGRGLDRVRGGDGNDIVHGNNDFFNKLYGGAGDDIVYAEGGADWAWGGDGADRLYGGRGYDTMRGGSGDDTLYGGTGSDTLHGDRGDDTLVSESDAGAPLDRVGEITLGNNGRWNDVLEGNWGADTFVFQFQMNAGREIAEKHADASGKVDWMGVMAENSAHHDHWVDWIGNDKILDFSHRQGDRIRIEGHTAQIRSLTHHDSDGDGLDDYSVIRVFSNQRAFMNMDMGGMETGGSGGGMDMGGAGMPPMAHDQDFLGRITVFGQLVRPEDIEVDPMAMHAAFDNISEIF